MQRGYIKFWRKAQDSSSWNRGLMYQGLIINLLSRAAWKKGSYQGRDILPGQFGVVLGLFADSVKVPKTTLHRMVSHLEEDGFLTVENVGHRFSLITIVNWQLYQANGGDAWNADGTPMEYQRNARGTPSYKEEEINKKEDIRTPLTPHGGDGAHEASPAAVVTDPADVDMGFHEFMAAYPADHRAPEAEAAAAWKSLTRAKKLPGLTRLFQGLDAWEACDQWRKDGGAYIPKAANFLRRMMWQDEPPKASPRASPRAPTVFQQNMQHFDDFATRELASRGIHLPGGLEHGHEGDDFTQTIDVGCRVPKLLSFVPFIGGLFEKFTESRGRAAELRAEKELVEAKAFKSGRIAPKYLMLYALVGVFVLFAAAVFVVVFFPSAMPDADLSRFRELIEAGEGMAGKM